MPKIISSEETSEINGNNQNNVKRETSILFRNEVRQYLKDKSNELATNTKNKNIRDLHRGVNEFKRGYQPRSNIVKAENGELLADSQKKF
jgi:hypothetical protein